MVAEREVSYVRSNKIEVNYRKSYRQWAERLSSRVRLDLRRRGVVLS